MADKVPAGNPADMRRQLVLGRVLLDGGQARQAGSVADALLALLDQRRLVAMTRVGALCLQGEAALAASERARARTALERCLGLAQSLQGSRPHSMHVGQAWLTLAQLEAADGAAAAVRSALHNALEHLQATVAATHAGLRRTQALLAQAG
jgi:hypothetical protein